MPVHEPAGIVAAIGAGVTNVREGDEVILQPSGYCGLCHYCRLGLTHYCEHAYTTGGDGPQDVRPGTHTLNPNQCDARSAGTKPLAMEKAILFMERGLVNPEQVISHRFPLAEIYKAVEVMAGPKRNKVIINP